MEKHSIIPRVADAQEPEQPAARANFPERRFPVTTRRGHSTDSPGASCSPMIWPGSICRWQTFYRAIKSLQTMCRGRGEAKIDLFPVRVFSHPARRGWLPGWLLTFVVVIFKNSWFWLIAWFSLYITTLLMWHVDEYKQSALLTNTVPFLVWCMIFEIFIIFNDSSLKFATWAAALAGIGMLSRPGSAIFLNFS